MSELDIIVRIAEIILFVALSVLAVYMIVSVKKITASVEKMNSTADELKKKLDPVLENSAILSADLIDVTSGIKKQVQKVDGIVDSVKGAADSLVEFEQRAQREVETQFYDSINFISSVVSAVKKFVSVISGSHNGSPRKKRLIEADDDSF